MFRPDHEPLLPNWRCLPVAYHGRAGTVVVSGTDVVRPKGQRKADEAAPTFGPRRRLDFELEMGFFVGVPTARRAVPVEAFADHVFGIVLVNDWSARDVQAWEYVPLGPFLGKSFQTSISAWVTPLALLEDARVEAPPQEPPPLPHLAGGRDWALDIALEVELNGEPLSPATRGRSTGRCRSSSLTRPRTARTLRTGDLMASGTISGAEPGLGRLDDRALPRRALPRGRRPGRPPRPSRERRRARRGTRRVLPARV